VKSRCIKKTTWAWILALILALVSGCSDNATEQNQQTATSKSGNIPPNSSEKFVLYAGSEMSGLEPMIKKWADKKGYLIQIHYKGSIDMMRMMKDGTATMADAFWPAHTIWFILGDSQHAVKNKRSIMVSPIVAGLKTSVVKKLGWDKQSPTMAAFLTAAQKNKFKYGKTSSTQSNSGALFHLAAWWAFAGKPDTWTMDLVKDPQIQARVKEMESTVAATSGSSGWLKSKIVNGADKLDGMINYEAMISEANIGWNTIDKSTGKNVHHPGLLEKDQEPLHVVYLSDATMMADHPLGYVDKGNGQKEKIFNALQNYLLSPDAQKKMISKGRRNKLLAMDPSLADKKAFNPEYGFDVEKVIAPIQPPREEVLTAILDLYQEAVRKPSATFWVIDDSGSMYNNNGKTAVQQAMSTLLTPEKAREYKLQPTPRDIHVVIPFSDTPGSPIRAQGNDPAILLTLMDKINRMHLGSGTDMYAGVVAALTYIKQHQEDIKGHFPAIAVLSDGQSKGSINDVRQAVKRLGLEDIPIFTLSFGAEADERQLKELAASFGGRYFSGHHRVADAFRKMKGYN
jgi:Ca-activated chloride channel family protein